MELLVVALLAILFALVLIAARPGVKGRRQSPIKQNDDHAVAGLSAALSDRQDTNLPSSSAEATLPTVPGPQGGGLNEPHPDTKRKAKRGRPPRPDLVIETPLGSIEQRCVGCVAVF